MGRQAITRHDAATRRAGAPALGRGTFPLVLALALAGLLARPGDARGQAPPEAPAPAERLVSAVYDGENTALAVYEQVKPGLPQAPDGRWAYAVVSKDRGGQIALHAREGGDLGHSALLSGIVALLGPQAAGGPAGGPVVDSLRAALVPGTSAVLGIVPEGSADGVAGRLKQARARSVLSARVTGVGG